MLCPNLLTRVDHPSDVKHSFILHFNVDVSIPHSG